MTNRALKHTLFFVLIGIVVILLIGYVQRNTLKTHQRNIPLVMLGEDLRSRLVQAQLLYYEAITGNGVDFETRVLPLLTSSQKILKGAYDGKETEIGKFHRPADEETLVVLKQALVDCEKLTALLNDTWKAYKTSGSEGEESSARQVTEAFTTFNNTLGTLSTHINETVDEDIAELNYLSWGSIVFVFLAFSMLAIVVYRSLRASDVAAAGNTKRLQEQERSVTALSSFVEGISAGDYARDLQMEGDDNLRNTLVKMRDKLRQNAEDDRKRNWSTTGLAQVGDILRATTSNTEELYDNIIKFVVKYTRSSHGGLFLLNDENPAELFLELVGCYAFERKKFLKRQVKIGEGMVGQCFLEGERIYLLEVPQEYISITSGLGGSNPNALLIVPLKVNDKMYGVLELATFGKYEDFEIDLVEKLGESIASTISSVRINQSTRMLLERTQQQAEEMRAQEEEMRQNMEELEATQEEMRRKEKHVQLMLDGEKQRNAFNRQSRQIILDLSKDKNVLKGNWKATSEKITMTVTKHLRITSTGIWEFEREKGKLVCLQSYNAETSSFESGAEWDSSQSPKFFASVKNEIAIMARDVYANDNTKEMAEAYLRPRDVRSIMTVPYFRSGHIAGILWCEQRRTQIDWTDDHGEFLNSCADLITVTLNTAHINSIISELNDSKDMMQAIIDNIPRAVFWKDRQLRFQGCNKIFARIAGAESPAALLGRTDFEMPWKAHAEAYRADDMAVMESKKARLDHEERNVNSEGVESWVLTSKVPVVNKSGDVVAVLGMFEDITDRKHREADVEKKLKELHELKSMIEKRQA